MPQYQDRNIGPSPKTSVLREKRERIWAYPCYWRVKTRARHSSPSSAPRRRDEVPFSCLLYFLVLVTGIWVWRNRSSGLVTVTTRGRGRSRGRGGRGGGKNGAEGRGVGQEEEDAASLSRALCAALMMHGETRAEPRWQRRVLYHCNGGWGLHSPLAGAFGCGQKRTHMHTRTTYIWKSKHTVLRI